MTSTTDEFEKNLRAIEPKDYVHQTLLGLAIRLQRNIDTAAADQSALDRQLVDVEVERTQLIKDRNVVLEAIRRYEP